MYNEKVLRDYDEHIRGLRKFIEKGAPMMYDT